MMLNPTSSEPRIPSSKQKLVIVRGRRTPQHEKRVTSPLRRTVTRPAPVARDYQRTTGMATSKPSKTGIRLSHREFFSICSSDVSSDIIWYWTIQPGWSSMFPWLSQMATRYEKYRMHKLTFEFVPRVPATCPGSLVIALDQDPDDQLPSSDEAGRMVLLSHAGAKSGSVWDKVTMDYPAQWLQAGERFVRADGEVSTVEPRTADLGMFFVGIFGAPYNTVLGDLMVSYDIELTIPQLLQPVQSSQTVFTTFGSIPGPMIASTPLVPVDSGGTMTFNISGAMADMFELVKIYNILIKNNPDDPYATYGLHYKGSDTKRMNLIASAAGYSEGSIEPQVLWSAQKSAGTTTAPINDARHTRSFTTSISGRSPDVTMNSAVPGFTLYPGDIIFPFLDGVLPSAWFNFMVTLMDVVHTTLPQCKAPVLPSAVVPPEKFPVVSTSMLDTRRADKTARTSVPERRK